MENKWKKRYVCTAAVLTVYTHGCLARIALFFSFFLLHFFLAAQQADNRKRVDIIHVDAIKSLLHEGKNIDRLIGNVQIMHNGTIMSCDSAYKFSSSEFEAYSRVTIIKNSTHLYGDALHYDGNTNIAQVRGKMVKLLDSTAMLRTQYLDFNTKDNIGHFFNGGTIENAGNLLESLHGYYYSDDKLFVFTDSVQIHNEIYDIQCDAGNYNTYTDIATFTAHTNIWHKDGFLSCDYGWYDKNRDFFHFSQNAYIMSQEQEIWADSVFYDRRTAMGNLYGHVQLLDTVQQSIAFGNEAHFFENPKQVILMKMPSVAYYTNNNNKPDTLFVRGDTLHFLEECHPDFCKKDTIISHIQDNDADLLMTNVISESVFSDNYESNNTLPSASMDSLQNIPILVDDMVAAVDTTQLQPVDTLPAQQPSDAIVLAVAIDSVITEILPKKITDSIVRKVYAYFNVRAFRQDIQAACDSFSYSSLDSLGRMFGRPAMWNEQRQITSKKIHFLNDPQKKQMIRADFLESAFIITHEQDSFYNQVKGRDITGYFRDNDLYLIDIYGGAQTVYYLQEDSIVANGNIAESVSMQIEVQQRKIRRIKYIEQNVSDTYPLDQLPQSKATLKGFEWREAERPRSRWEICAETPRASLRQKNAGILKPTFHITKRIDKIR